MLAVGLATLLANRGLDPLVDDAARSRLQRSGTHMAEVAAAVFEDEGGWSQAARETLAHLAQLDGLRMSVLAGGDRFGSDLTGAETASAPVIVAGRRVGHIEVAQEERACWTPEERHLQHSLDRLHLAAARLPPRRSAVATAPPHPPCRRANRARRPAGACRPGRRPGGALGRAGVEPARGDARARGGDPARAAAESFAPRFAEAEIDFDVTAASAWVDGDAGRLEQIVSNLLFNALRYTERDGTVVLRVERAGDDVVLEVTDTGAGIAPDDLRHIFTRFWRGDRSRSRATGGAGIGLAIVRELVRAHEGRVDVDSVLGHGSRFRVVLPAADRPEWVDDQAPALDRARL